MKKFANRFGFYGLIAVLAVLLFGSAYAGFRVRGDFPDTGLNYRIEAYDAPQTNMCDGVADTGTNMYFSSPYVTGDNAYDDDDDFDVNYSGTLGGATTVYFYFCGPGGNAAAKVVEFTKVVNDGDDLEIDLGYVQGGADVHNDLAGHYVYICSSLGGSTLSSETKQTDATTAEYTQYYYIDRGDIADPTDDPTSAYVLFDVDTTSPCVWDATKSTGRKIVLDTSLPDNYGVYVTFEPDTKVQGDLHANLANATFELYDSSNNMIGMAHQGYIGVAPDGLDDADDDYVLYYDAPVAGDLSLRLTPDGVAVESSHITELRAIDSTAFAAGGYDFIFDISDSGKGVPSDVSSVEVAMTIGTDNVVFHTNTVANGAINEYDLFVDNAGTGSDGVDFFVGANKVLTVTRDLSSATGSDQTIDVGKVSGDAHAGIEAAGDDPLDVYNDISCTNKVSSISVSPSDNPTGVDYAQYFEDDGSATFYIGISKDGTYNICGNGFALGLDQTASKDLTVELYGLVPADIDNVYIDTDQSGAFDNSDVATAPVAGTYYLYTSPDAAVDVVFESAGVVELKRTKDLSTDLSLHVAKVSGNVHANLGDLNGDTISVYADPKCLTQLSSEVEQPDSTATPNYIQFYEVNGAMDYFLGVNAAVGANNYFSCVRFTSTGNGASDTVNVDTQLTGTMPAGVSVIAVDLNQDGNVDAATGTLDASNNYYLYFPADTDTTANVELFDASDNVLLNRVRNLSADNTFDAARVIGDVHTNLQDGTDVVEVCTDNTCTAKLSSEIVNPVAGTGTNDSYAVYYEVPNTGTTNVILHVIDNDTVAYNSYVDVYVLNGANILPGDTDIVDLTQIIQGTVVPEIDWIFMDNDGIGDNIWEAAADTNGNTYRLYHWYTASTLKYLQADEDSDESTQNLVVQKDVGVASLDFNVDAIRGDVPADFVNDTFEVETAAGGLCDGTAYTLDTLPANVATQSYDYYLYVEADGSTYYVLACNDTNKELEKARVASGTGGVYHDLNIAKVFGEAHSDLEDSTTADNVSVYQDEACATTELTSETEQPLNNKYTTGDDYMQFYEVSGAGTYYMKIVRDGVYETCLAFTSSGDGGVDSVDIIEKVSGSVPSDVTMVAVQSNNDANARVDGGTSTYALYTTPGNLGDKIFAFVNTNMVLQRTIDLVADVIWNVSKISGNAHANLQETDAADNIEVCSTADCSATIDPLSSENISIGITYTQYYESNDANIYLHVIDSDGVNTWETFIDPGITDAAGSANAYNIDIRVFGKVPDDITAVELDPNQNGVWEIRGTVAETNPDTYNIYFAGSASADVRYLDTGSNELQLNNQVLSSDSEINVAEAIGTVHLDLQDVGDTINVCADIDCITPLTGATGAKGTTAGSYEIDFWVDPTVTTFWLQVYDNAGYYSYVNLSSIYNYSAGSSIQGGETIGADLTRKISGTVPHTLPSGNIDAIWLDLNADATTTGDFMGDPNATTGDYELFHGLANGAYIIMADTDETPGGEVLSRTITIGGDETFNVGAVYSTTACHASLQGGTVDVYSEWDLINKLSSEIVNCGATGYTQYFEQPIANTLYFMKIIDPNSYESVHAFATTAFGDSIVQDLSGLLSGTVVEAYDNTTPIADVHAELWDATGSEVIAKTLTLADGTYRIYSAAATGTGYYADTYDANFWKQGYVTNYIDGDFTLDNVLDVALRSGIIVTVVDAGGQPITDATVKVLTDVNPETVLTGCTNPAGDCVRDANNAVGGVYTFAGFSYPQDVAIKVEKLGYTTVVVPDYDGSVEKYYRVTSGAPWEVTVPLYNAPPAEVQLLTPLDGETVGTSTPTLKWLDLGVDEIYYEVEVDDDPDFSSPVVDTNAVPGNITNLSVSLGPSSDGNTYYWRVRAYDGVNWGPWSEVRRFTVDISAPDQPTVTINDGATYTNSLAVNVKVTSSGATYCKLSNDNTTWSNWISYSGANTVYSWNLNPGDGTKTVYVICKNDAGLTSGSNSDTIELDTTPPSNVAIELQYGVAYYNSQTVAMYTHATDNSSLTCDYSFDGTTWNSLTNCNNSGIVITLPGTGLQTVFFRATDAAGNSVTVSDEIVIDVTSPSNVTGVTASIEGKTVKITWNASQDNQSGIAYYNIYRKPSTITTWDYSAHLIARVPGKVSGGATEVYYDSTLLEGTYDYKVTAVDKVGNESDGAETTISVDFIAPFISIVAINYGAEYTNTSNVNVFISVTDNNALKQCDVSSTTTSWTSLASFSAGTSTYSGAPPVTLSTSDGTKTLYVRCLDWAGNVSDYVADTIVLDTTAPSTPTAVTPTTAVVTGSSFTWDWSASTDNLSGVAYYVIDLKKNGTTVASENVTETYYTASNLEEGIYTLSVVAVDYAGNSSGTLTFADVTVDLTKPSANIASPTENGYTNDTTPTFTFDVSSDVTNCHIVPYINGTQQAEVVIAPTASQCSYTPAAALTEGSNIYVSIIVVDAAGNESYAVLSPTLYIDTTAPTVTISSPTDGTTITTTTPTIKFTVADNLAGVKAQNIDVLVNGVSLGTQPNCTANKDNTELDCSIDVPAGVLADPSAANTITVNAIDDAGNQGSAQVTFDIDSSDFIQINSITATRTVGIADDTYDSGWRFDFNVTFGTSAAGNKTKLRIKLDDWINASDSSKTIEVEGNARMVYYANINGNKVEKIYYIANDYNTAQTVYDFWDENPATPEIDAVFYIEQKLPSNTAAGTYYTTYAIKTFSN